MPINPSRNTRLRGFMISLWLLASMGLNAGTPLPDSAKRGEYLVYGPAACVRCHGSIRQMADFEHHGAKIPLGGGKRWSLYLGEFIAPNISSDKTFGTGSWTDAELFRAIRNDQHQDGTALIPMMEYRHMSDDDVRAVIAFLRVSQPVHHAEPPSQWSLIGKVAQTFLSLGKRFSSDPTQHPVTAPKQAPDAAYGKYLVHDVAQCAECHTARSQLTGRFYGPLLAGGNRFTTPYNPDLQIVVPNITPHGKTSKIRDWTQQDFIKRFREGLKIEGSHMPWGAFQHMSDEDLKAIWLYLQQVPSSDQNPGPVLQPTQ